MKRSIFYAAILLILLQASLTGKAASQETLTGYQIMEKVENRLIPDDMKMVTVMNLIDKRGKIRKRDLRTFRFSDTKQIMWFLKPADIKGSSFLKFTYDDRDDDMWIYLTDFGKVRRIASHAKKGSFMGSDFTFEDMGDRKLDDYTYKLLKEETAGGKDCWIVESIPNKGVITDYSKMILWVDKTALFPLKTEYYDKRGRLKKNQSAELIKMEKYWVIKRMFMENLKTKHKTEILINEIEINTGLEEKYFDKSYMKRIQK